MDGFSNHNPISPLLDPAISLASADNTEGGREAEERVMSVDRWSLDSLKDALQVSFAGLMAAEASGTNKRALPVLGLPLWFSVRCPFSFLPADFFGQPSAVLCGG